MGAVSAASASGDHGPARGINRYAAYQTVAVVAATCSAVQSQPTTPNGRSARGMPSTAANGG